MLAVKVMKEMKEEKSEYLEILNEDSLLDDNVDLLF